MLTNTLNEKKSQRKSTLDQNQSRKHNSISMRTVWVYKTDVDDRSKAKAILDEIHQNLPNCDASFDLEDCDKVLRVEYVTPGISEQRI